MDFELSFSKDKIETTPNFSGGKPINVGFSETIGKGSDGKSAYEIAVENGFVGSEKEWLASLKGEDGVSIVRVEQTKTSTEDNGRNEATITLSNGRTFVISFRNGSKGSNGNGIASVVLNSDYTLTIFFTNGETYTTPISIRGEDGKTPYIQDGYWYIGGVSTGIKAKGEDGVTPVKGKDYFTENEKTEIARQASVIVSESVQETVSSGIATHNVSPNAHNDIRLLISGLTQRLNALADSDDTTLDQMSEIVAYIKANKLLIESVTTNKVNVSDIINNLTTNVANKPLSASQGVVLKGLVDALSTSKLNASELPTAINTALAQAKASGEFDGKDGANGVSATHSWDGTVLTVTSASGTSSANLQGEKGNSGVFVGSGEMPDGYNVQIDTTGEDDMSAVVDEVLSSFPNETWTFTLADGTVVEKKVVLV